MKQDGMRVIATVMGEPDSTTRNSEVSSMLDYAFATVGLKKVLSKDSVIEKINLSKAKVDDVEIVPVEDVNILYKKVEGEFTPTYDIKIEIHHYPFSLRDIVEIVLRKRMYYKESIEVQMTAKEVSIAGQSQF